jgi:hypothetical protein
VTRKTVLEFVCPDRCFCHPVLYMTLIIAEELTEKCICLLWIGSIKVVIQKMSGLSKLFHLWRYDLET